MDYTRAIQSYINSEIDILRRLDIGSVNEVMNLLEETRKRNGSVYIFGNGGSASTAAHFQCDFNKGVSEQIEKKYRFVCLNDNIATIMAIANDNGYNKIFVQQLENKLQKEDIVIAISGSGNSENVINAVEYAKQCGNLVVGITGYDGGRLKQISDVSLHVNINNMQIVEDVHLIYNHLMMYILHDKLVEGTKYE